MYTKGFVVQLHLNVDTTIKVLIHTHIDIELLRCKKAAPGDFPSLCGDLRDLNGDLNLVSIGTTSDFKWGAFEISM